jgi:hypothetical protein
MFNLICDLVGASLFILFLIWAIRLQIRIYKTEKECKKAFPNWNKKSIPVKFEMRKKICTQTQPFVIDDKHSIICNFPCDGNCHLI